MVNEKVETWSNSLTRWFHKLVIPTKPKYIVVKGFSQINEVTVQVFEDGLLTNCNHVNSHLELVFSDEGTDDERSKMMHVCDKKNCNEVIVEC